MKLLIIKMPLALASGLETEDINDDNPFSPPDIWGLQLQAWPGPLRIVLISHSPREKTSDLYKHNVPSHLRWKSQLKISLKCLMNPLLPLGLAAVMMTRVHCWASFCAKLVNINYFMESSQEPCNNHII